MAATKKLTNAIGSIATGDLTTLERLKRSYMESWPHCGFRISLWKSVKYGQDTTIK